MVKDWKLREEIYIIFHQWPTILFFFAIGCIIGWIATLILPVSYRSTAQIHVGLNPYRTYEDATFLALARPKYSNVDDYKHWQMSQLDSAIFLDALIDDALAILQNNDKYWKEVDAAQLRTMLDADWRSAGVWSLTANHRNAIYARQASQAWSDVVIDHISAAVQSSRDTFMIDQKLQEISSDLVQSETRYERLSITKELLLDWEKTAASLPENQPFESNERWQILSKVSQAALFTPAWETLLNNQPSGSAPTPAYIDWIDQVIAQIDVEASLLQQHITSLETTHDSLAKQYSNSSDASLGLSPNIAIEGREISPPEAIRSSSLLILVGGVVGLCAWIFYQLVRITRRKADSEGPEQE